MRREYSRKLLTQKYKSYYENNKFLNLGHPGNKRKPTKSS